MIQRRALLRGIGAIFAAPAIVRASSLMALPVARSRIIEASTYVTRLEILYGAISPEFVEFFVRTHRFSGFHLDAPA